MQLDHAIKRSTILCIPWLQYAVARLFPAPTASMAGAVFRWNIMYILVWQSVMCWRDAMRMITEGMGTATASHYVLRMKSFLTYGHKLDCENTLRAKSTQGKPANPSAQRAPRPGPHRDSG
jgi:hypothetical protein